MSFDPIRDYPLGSRRPDLVSTLGGTPLAEVTLEAVRAERISSRDARATPATLRRQAAVARAAGREPLAESLERAAELAGRAPGGAGGGGPPPPRRLRSGAHSGVRARGRGRVRAARAARTCVAAASRRVSCGSSIASCSCRRI